MATKLPQDETASEGTRKLELGPYRLDAKLGRGGMGEVYKAWDGRLKRWVAVKRLIALTRSDEESTATARARFRLEAQTVAQIQHPSVVQIFDILESGDDDWIVMELVEGTDLAHLLRQGPFEVELARECGAQIASGLAALHEKGIVHRDLKTENVMMTRADAPRVKLLDFGLAKAEELGPKDASALTLPGHIVGTPRAMSPEQARGQEILPRSDLFSLGVLLYELLTGRSPFKADSIAETLSRLLTYQPPPAAQLNQQVPKAFSDLIDQLLRKDPRRRPTAATTVAQALESHSTPASNDLPAEEPAEDRTMVDRPVREMADTVTATFTARPPANKASVWNIPHRRNPFFTGRRQTLEDLRRALDEQGGTGICRAITGLGGIGKTQTAVEYCYVYRDQYSAVLWARAETEAELRSEMAAIATLLALPGAAAQEQDIAVEATRRWLDQNSGWLLVFDNADHPEILGSILPRDPQGTILLTSRAPRFSALGIRQPLRMRALPKAEAEALLVERAGRRVESEAERQAVADLAEELGCLPLALEQAGAYVETTQTRFQSYLADYRKRQLAVVEKARPETGDYQESVATTWSMSFLEVAKASAASADLLTALSLLAPDAIPLELFEEAAEWLGPTLAAALGNDDRLAVSEVLEPLMRFSLIERDVEGHTISVHRMVQAVVRAGTSEATRRGWAERLVQALARIYPRPEFKTWPRCERLHAQARTAAELIETSTLESPESMHLLSSAGSYAVDRGRYREAEPLFRQALAIRQRTLGEGHPDIADSLAELANLYYLQGRYDETEPLLLQALEIRRLALGEEHPDVAESFNRLAILYRPQGRYDEAEALHRQALEIREKTLDVNHPDLAHSLTNLAALYRDLGRYDEAEPLDRRSLEIRETFGVDHPTVSFALTNLAALCRDLGRYDEAETLALRALEIRRKALGADDPGIAPCLSTLASLYSKQGRYEEAESFFQRSLEIQEKALGPDHPGIAFAVLGLARLHELQEEPAQAELCFQRGLELRTKAFGADHPLTVKAGRAYEDFLRAKPNF